MPCPADTFSSSGLYPVVSKDISSFVSPSSILIKLLSSEVKSESDLLPKMSGIFNAFSFIDLLFPNIFEEITLDSMAVMLSSKRFLDSSKKVFCEVSISVQLSLKKGSSKKESLIVNGIIDSVVLVFS